MDPSPQTPAEIRARAAATKETVRGAWAAVKEATAATTAGEHLTADTP